MRKAQRSMAWFRRMMDVYQGMSTEEQEALHRWEAENLCGPSLGTSDWPGWANYLPPPPWKQN